MAQGVKWAFEIPVRPIGLGLYALVRGFKGRDLSLEEGARPA